MIWISFSNWATKSGSMFIWERVYRNGYQWTPFIMARIRYPKRIDKYDKYKK